MREIDDLLSRRPELGVLVDEVSAFKVIVSSADHTGLAGASPLTPAELRLLPYLQTHLSFREVGERLFISRNTVSSEVNAIYRKLGVSSRYDAVERATAVGLLGGQTSNAERPPFLARSVGPPLRTLPGRRSHGF